MAGAVMRNLLAALILLIWTLPPAVCAPAGILVWDAYIEGGTGTVHAAIGYRLVAPWQSAITVATGKPDMPDCAIAWRVTAVDANMDELVPSCQPTNVSADGQSWGGM
jgi:hypothetical protein